MARWKVVIAGKGVQRRSVEKLVNAMREEFGEGVQVHCSDDTPPESRADRFEQAKSWASDARTVAEELRDELQGWYDNLPEAFQQGEKGEQLQTAIDELDGMVSNLEEVETRDVEFPGMYA